MKIKIKSVILGKRGRKSYNNLQELADSLSKRQIHPIVIRKEDNMLIAGGRRLAAACLLDWTEIGAVYLEDVDEIERRELELEENLIREDLTWQEEVTMKRDLDVLKKGIDENWETKDTAGKLHEDVSQTNRDLALRKAMDEFPELKNEENKTNAWSKAKKLKKTALRKILVQSSKKIGGIYYGDCLDILPTLPNNSFHLALLDPPFAVHLDKSTTKTKRYPHIYGALKDNPENIFPLVREAIRLIIPKLVDGGHLYLFFASMRIRENLIILRRSEFNFQPQWLAWIKPSNMNYRPTERFTVNYEPFFFCWKGAKPNPLRKSMNSTFHYKMDTTQGRDHPAEKPPELYRDLIEVSTEKGERVLDPFMGSGVSLATAKQLGREIVGIEKNIDYFNLSQVNIKKGVKL